MAPVPASVSSSAPLSLLLSLPTAALSIHELARLNCRERLLVPPIQWTGRHVELLQCSFEEPCTAPHLLESDFSSTGYKLAKRLFRGCSTSWRERTIELILADHECPLRKARPSLGFHFNRNLVSTLPCLTFNLRSDKAVVSYIDRTHIENLRFDYAWSREPPRSSEAVRSLCKLKFRHLKPPEPHHDPYIVAMLIATANKQRNALRRDDPMLHIDSCSTYLSQVLLTDVNDQENIHLFTAHIPSSLLDKLDFPALRPPLSAPPAVSIKHTTISYRPYRTFRMRLLLLLLPMLKDSEPSEGIYEQP